LIGFVSLQKRISASGVSVDFNPYKHVLDFPMAQKRGALNGEITATACRSLLHRTPLH